VAFWGLLAAIQAILARGAGQHPTTCLFKRWSGHPCPTCGSTRALEALLDADVAQAIWLNPLVVVGSVVILLVLCLRALSGRTLQLEGAERKWIVPILVALLLADWIWVIRHGG